MRTSLTPSGYSVVYPDEIVFTGDVNLITVSHPTSNVGVQIQLGSKIVSYTSEQKMIEFDVSQIIVNEGEGTKQLTIYITSAPSEPQIITSVTVVHGRSIPQRTHGATSRIIYDGSSSTIDVFCVKSCIISCDGVDRSGTAGINVLPASSEIKISYTEQVAIGDIFGSVISDTHRILVEEPCMPSNGVIIYYRDADGCRRCFVGKVMSEVFSPSAVDYRGGSMYRHAPKRHVNSIGSSFSVGIKSVDPQTYLEDVMMSDDVYMVNAAGETISLSPKSISAQRDGKVHDVIIELTSMI